MNPSCCSIVELREYTMQPGGRDTFAEMFDREFVETQQEWGIHVIGQFLDADRPDRFVWMRGFEDMDSRREALTAFYDGPTWAEHRDAANSTMIDSDNVLLLHPASDGSGFDHATAASHGASGIYVVTVAPHDVILSADGSCAEFVTEHSANTYPRLPIREGEDVRVLVRRFDSLAETSREPGDWISMRLLPTPRSALR